MDMAKIERRVGLDEAITGLATLDCSPTAGGEDTHFSMSPASRPHARSKDVGLISTQIAAPGDAKTGKGLVSGAMQRALRGMVVGDGGRYWRHLFFVRSAHIGRLLRLT